MIQRTEIPHFCYTVALGITDYCFSEFCILRDVSCRSSISVTMAPETPKGVSSRLLTMKFMQRAIASNTTAASPESESHSTKKRKLDNGSPAGRLSMDFDQASVDAAMQAQEAKRKAALQQHATSDTHWVLNTKFEPQPTKRAPKAPRRIVYVGYGDIDSENDSGDGEDVAANGRTTTIKPKPKAEVCTTY